MTRSATIEQTFEVIVRIKGEVRMKHFDAKDCHCAMRKAQLAGYRVISAHKLEDIAGSRRILGQYLENVLEIKLEPEPSYTALQLSEIAFRRQKRIENNKQDKEKYFNKGIDER